MNKAEFLTVRWNNLLSVGLGLPVLGYVVAGLAATSPPDRVSFIGLMVLGVMY